MADHPKTTPWTDDELDDATRRLEAATKAATPTPLNPTPWLSDAPKGSPKPETPKALGGLWYHEQQSIETTQQSVGKARAWAAERGANRAARAAEKLAQDAAARAARKAQEAAQEAAREAAAAKRAELAALAAAHARAANKRAARETAERAAKAAALGAAIKAGREAALAANPPSPAQPDTKAAKYGRRIWNQMFAREILAAAMGPDAPRQQSAIEHAALLCNRLIENLFPPVDFSDMPMIKNFRNNYGYINPEDRPKREDNDE